MVRRRTSFVSIPFHSHHASAADACTAARAPPTATRLPRFAPDAPRTCLVHVHSSSSPHFATSIGLASTSFEPEFEPGSVRVRKVVCVLSNRDSFGLKPRQARLGRTNRTRWCMAHDTHEMATTASLVVAREAKEDAHGWKSRTTRTEEMEVGATACAKETKKSKHTNDHAGRTKVAEADVKRRSRCDDESRHDLLGMIDMRCNVRGIHWPPSSLLLRRKTRGRTRDIPLRQGNRTNLRLEAARQDENYLCGPGVVPEYWCGSTRCYQNLAMCSTGMLVGSI